MIQDGDSQCRHNVPMKGMVWEDFYHLFTINDAHLWFTYNMWFLQQIIHRLEPEMIEQLTFAGFEWGEPSEVPEPGVVRVGEEAVRSLKRGLRSMEANGPPHTAPHWSKSIPRATTSATHFPGIPPHDVMERVTLFS